MWSLFEKRAPKQKHSSSSRDQHRHGHFAHVLNCTLYLPARRAYSLLISLVKTSRTVDCVEGCIRGNISLPLPSTRFLSSPFTPYLFLYPLKRDEVSAKYQQSQPRRRCSLRASSPLPRMAGNNQPRSALRVTTAIGWFRPCTHNRRRWAEHAIEKMN